MNIFQKNHYTEIIKDYLRQNSNIRGYQTRLAEAAGVHGSYLSRVMNEKVHLTPDQAALLCLFWKLTLDETDYFIALVNLARAGTKELKAIFKRQISETKKKHEEFSHRYADAKALDVFGQGLYYSAWYYSAIHFLLMIPRYHSAEDIAQRLNLPLALVQWTLETLQTLNLARKEGDQWRATTANLHTGNDSPWASVYHSGYRQRVAFKVHEKIETDMHYTGLHPMSVADFLKVKSILKDSMEKVRSVALPSKEEELYCICLDWFKI